MTSRVSVVVPTRDRPRDLARCLAGLAAQSLDGGLEIIVVDDGSHDADAAARLAARTPGARVLRRDGEGPAAARNAGARDARAPHVLFCDDDCLPTPMWAATLAAALDDVDAAVGRTVPPAGARATTRAWHAIVDHVVAAGHDRSAGTVLFGPSCNLAVRAELVRAMPFDARFPLAAGEDRDWCARVVGGGGRIGFVPESVVVHHQDLGPRAFWRQQVRYGRGAARYRAASPGTRPLEGASFYAGLVRRGFAAGADAGLLVLAAQAATAVGVAAERRSSPPRGSDVDPHPR